MTDWLALLKNRNTPGGHATKPTEPGFVGFVASSVEGFENSPTRSDRTREFENTGGGHATKPTELSAARWLVRFADRLLEVVSDPARTRAEWLAIYPDALDAEPLAEETPEPEPVPEPQRCTQCQHYRRPGRSAGYCTGRADLRHAYGLLYELPAGRGEDCLEFVKR